MDLPKILRSGIVYPCAVCPRCGLKIYPGSELQYHLYMHDARDLRAAKWARDLRKTFHGMRWEKQKISETSLS